MKRDIHPRYKAFKITMTDGTKFVTNSTCEADELILDVDFRNHPAWRGGVAAQINQKASQIAKFNKKFGALSAISSKDDSKKEDSQK